MNSLLKRAAVAIRAAAIAFLMAAALPVAAQTGSTKFIPTFLIYSGGGPALVASDAAKLAKFDLLDFDRWRYNSIGSNTWAAIKSLNPNAQIYLYEMGPEAPSHLDAVAQVNLNGLGRHNVSRGHPQGSLNGNNPGLFQLNASGNRIYNLYTSNPAASQYWYLMDFGSAAYQSYWLDAVKADIVNQPWVADGIVADRCTAIASAGTYSAPSAWYSTNATWSAAMNSFAGAITAGLRGVGQKLWCNRGETRTVDGSAAWKTLDNSVSSPDVLLEEGAFAVQWGNANTQFYTESEWKRQVDIMGAIKNSKVAMLSHTKLLEGQAGADNYGRPVTYWQTLWFSLGSFLLGKNDQLNNTYFMFNGGSGYNKIWWHDEYDKIDLGKAIGPYAVRTIGSAKVYWREFEKGYVYVNPSPSHATSVSLPKASKLLTHANLLSPPSSIANVNAIALKSHDAAILLKADITPPSVPTGLMGTAVSATQINLNWTASTDNVAVTGYRVYRGGALITTLGNVTTYQNTGLTASTTYAYTVQAVDAAGNASAQSAAASATTQASSDTTPPSIPTGLTGTAVSATQINLSWTASTDNVAVTGYRVYRGGALITTLGNVTTYQNTGLTASTAYTYTVRAIDAAGNASAQSTAASATTQAASDTTAPSVPTGLTGTAVSATQINLAWSAATDNVAVTGYRVFRGGALITTLGNVTAYQNTGLTASTAYTYTVRAIDAAGNASGQSTAASATTPAPPLPGTVSNLSATSVTSNSATLSFTEVNNGTGLPAKYDIRFNTPTISWGSAPRVTSGTCATPLQGTSIGATKTCTVTGLTSNATYQFQLVAFSGTLNAGAVFGGLSNIVAATTLSAADATPPSTPTGLTANAVSASQINLSWSASTDNVAVTGYRVERCQGAGCVNFAQVATPIGTNYSNTGLAAGTTYRYRVRAADGAGNLSGYSNIVSATTSSGPPGGTAALAWDAVTADLSGYRIYYGTAPGTYLQPLGQGVNVGNVTTYAVTGLGGGTRYYFVVTAFDTSNNESIFSNEVSMVIP